jgi:hypothetical protein
MERGLISTKSFCILSGLSSIAGVVLLGLSFRYQSRSTSGCEQR